MTLLGGLNPFTVFLETIPYRFYPLLALYFAALTAFSRMDFGPMAAAEQRAASGGGLLPARRPARRGHRNRRTWSRSRAPSHRWWNAAIPVLTVIVVVLGRALRDRSASVGPDAPLSDVFGAADPFATLLWGSLAGCVVAIADLGRASVSSRWARASTPWSAACGP